jgi:hypothetical protein
MYLSKPIAAETRFGRLTVVRLADTKHHSFALYLCVCDCGGEKLAKAANLKRGYVKSCGCLVKENGLHSHGQSYSSTYRIWIGIKTRCLNQNDAGFKKYGARGITICERWANSFENFLADMGERPPGLTIDRIDNAMGYAPGNCRWATWEIQRSNRRDSKRMAA